MFKRGRLGIIILLSLFVISSAAYASVPQTINYQGKLTDSGGAAVNATVTMVFSIYNGSTGGTALWTETHSVDVVNGIYSVTLGDSTPITLPFDEQYYLGVKVGSDAEMTPRQALTSVGYSFAADTAGTAADFSGSLSGDVTGTQSSTAVSQVGGLSAANVAAGAGLANNATSANTASTIVKRDSSGDFYAHNIHASAFYGDGSNLTGISSGGGGGIVVKDSSSTPQTIGTLVNADMYGFTVLTSTGYMVGFNWDNSKYPGQIYWTTSGCGGIAYLNDGWGGSGSPQIMFGKSAVWSTAANSYMVPYTVTNGYSTSVTFTAASIENPTCYSSSGTDSGWRLKTITNSALGIPGSITLPFTLN